METMVEPQAQRRLTLVAWFGVLWGVILIARLIQLHVIEHENLRLVAIRQQEHIVDVVAARGTIFSGGAGGGPLALSVPVRRVAINPLRIPEGGEPFVVSVLEQLLGLNAEGLMGPVISLMSFLFIVGVSGLELLVCAIQAYVFALLTSLYINDAVNLH